MKRFILLIASIILCCPDPGLTQETLVVAGTGDSQAILRKIARLFEQHYPSIRIEVPESTGSGGGVKALRHSRVEMARTARPLKNHEKPGLTPVLFAKSPVAFSAHPSLKQIKSLTNKEILDIYRGNITSWSQVGGPEAKIYVIDRETGDSSRKVLTRTMPGFKEMESVAKTFFSTPNTAAAIQEHPHTLGYLPLSMAREYDLHVMAINGVKPTADSVAGGSYPHVTPFYLVHDSDPSPLALSFIDFASSTAAKKLMLANGVIPAR